MSAKRKLAMGALSGALALALIGGGTLAAFNDVEAFDNRFATGTLDLEIEFGDKVDGQQVHGTFDLSNFKPGDSMTRTFKLINAGTLSIQHVLLHFDLEAIQSSFKGQEGVTWEEFLDQFQVTVFRADQGTGEGDVTEHPPLLYESCCEAAGWQDAGERQPEPVHFDHYLAHAKKYRLIYPMRLFFYQQQIEGRKFADGKKLKKQGSNQLFIIEKVGHLE